jgi:serine/threonine protein kinase
VLGKKILRGRAYFDIIIQCAEIFISLHKQGLVHCDIKIENVIHDLVKQISTVVDPGSLLDKAELEWNKPVSIRGSSVNISPENIDLHMRTGKMKFNPATDMYGFGTLCIDLLGTKILMPINDGVIMPHVDPTIKLPSEIEFAKIALKTKLHLKDVNDPLITEIISETNSMVDLEQCRPSWEEVLIFFKQKREEYLTRHPLEKFRPIILLDVNNNNDISVTKDVLKGFKLGTYEVWLVDSNSRSSEIDQKHIDLYLSLKRGNIPVTRDIFLSDEGNLPGLLSHVRSTETNDNYIYAYFHWTSDKSMRVDGIKTILLQPDKRQKDYQSEFWNYLESLPVRENLAPLNSLENHPLPAAAPVAAAPSIELFSDRVNNLFKPILDNEELNLSDEIKRLLAMLEMALYTRTEQFSQEEERQDFFDNYIVPLMNNIQKMLLEIQNSSKQNSLQIINNCRMTVIQLRSSEKSAWSCICCLFSSKGNNYCEKEIGELIKKLAQEAKGKNTEDAPLIPNVDPYSSPPF